VAGVGDGKIVTCDVKIGGGGGLDGGVGMKDTAPPPPPPQAANPSIAAVAAAPAMPLMANFPLLQSAAFRVESDGPMCDDQRLMLC